jgi:hypothetical protein
MVPQKVETIFDGAPGKMNEDVLLVHDNLYGVFDGATGLVPYIKNNKTGGQIAAGLAKETFEAESGTFRESAIKANDRIRKVMRDAGVNLSDKVGLWATGAAVIKLNENDFEWLQINDCIILVIYNDNTFSLLVKDYGHDEISLVALKELRQRGKSGPARELIMPKIEQVRRAINVEYGAINGEPEMERFLKEGKESLKNIKHILLFTDGLIIPTEEPSQPDNFQHFVKLFLEGGLAKVKSYVRELETQDPEIWKYFRTKPHDDIAAVALSF